MLAAPPGKPPGNAPGCGPAIGDPGICPPYNPVTAMTCRVQSVSAWCAYHLRALFTPNAKPSFTLLLRRKSLRCWWLLESSSTQGRRARL